MRIFHLFLWKRLQYILWLTDKKELFELVIWLLDVKDCRKGYWEVLCFYGVKVIMCDCIYHSATEEKKTEFVNVKVPLSVKIRQYMVDTMLHDHFICCGHHFTWPKHKKGYIDSCWWALLDKACCSLIKNSALEYQHLNTQKLRAHKTTRISQQFGLF